MVRSNKKKKGSKEKSETKTGYRQPILRTKKASLGQKAADWLARWAGSWIFIGIFAFCLAAWALLNTVTVIFGVWDVYPFILLNLFLSCLAAIQAPVILMSQNRQAEVDRHRSQYDYLVNRKAEREVKQLQLDVLEIKEVVLKQSTRTQAAHLREEIMKIQDELNKLGHKIKK
jgi:uncharacterized membrane protein